MDRQEFERLALEQLDAVYRMALHLSRNPHAAEDLVQDVYARALRPSAVEGFEDRTGDGSGGMRAWLFTICHNLFYSKIKRERRGPQAMGEIPVEADGPLPDEPPPAWNRATFDWEHVDDRLRKAVDELRSEYREVLLMWGVEGLKYREIAAILEVPIGTVMSRLHRARKLLADALTGDEGLRGDLGLSRLLSAGEASEDGMTSA
ncbi:MAG: sigma-70 family RNA polymerase sigma factor [Phycisphaeraceae bacterium]|nr:sigma-70 family RNA polymerase sigma factor [Phycisphaeraceae bacterium]